MPTAVGLLTTAVGWLPTVVGWLFAARTTRPGSCGASAGIGPGIINVARSNATILFLTPTAHRGDQPQTKSAC